MNYFEYSLKSGTGRTALTWRGNITIRSRIRSDIEEMPKLRKKPKNNFFRNKQRTLIKCL